jgi:hypothetical protein
MVFHLKLCFTFQFDMAIGNIFAKNGEFKMSAGLPAIKPVTTQVNPQLKSSFFQKAPIDAQSQCLSYLSLSDVLACTITCRLWCDRIEQDSILWQELYAPLHRATFEHPNPWVSLPSSKGVSTTPEKPIPLGPLIGATERLFRQRMHFSQGVHAASALTYPGRAPATGRPPWREPPTSYLNTVCCTAVSPARQSAIGLKNGKVEFWEYRDGAMVCVDTIQAHEGKGVWSIDFSTDGSMITWAAKPDESRDGYSKIWRQKAQKWECSRALPEVTSLYAALSPDGTLFTAEGNHSTAVKILKCPKEAWVEECEVETEEENLYGVGFIPGGGFLTNHDCQAGVKIKIWQKVEAEWSCTKTFEGLGRKYFFTADGKFGILGIKAITIFNQADWKEEATLNLPESIVSEAVGRQLNGFTAHHYSPKQVVAIRYEGPLTVWVKGLEGWTHQMSVKVPNSALGYTLSSAPCVDSVFTLSNGNIFLGNSGGNIGILDFGTSKDVALSNGSPPSLKDRAPFEIEAMARSILQLPVALQRIVFTQFFHLYGSQKLKTPKETIDNAMRLAQKMDPTKPHRDFVQVLNKTNSRDPFATALCKSVGNYFAELRLPPRVIAKELLRMGADDVLSREFYVRKFEVLTPQDKEVVRKLLKEWEAPEELLKLLSDQPAKSETAAADHKKQDA